MRPEECAVKTEELTRIFRLRKREAREGKREILALDRVSLEILPGELFGLLGPNGAGKTTLIKILATLLTPTSGRAFVAGVDVVENPVEVRRHINMVTGGETSGYGLLTVEENLWMFAQFYGIPSREARRRIRELLSLGGHGRPRQDQGLPPLLRHAAKDEHRAGFPHRAGDPFPR
jgi:ABC-2 type transport system ATP-binding protein